MPPVFTLEGLRDDLVGFLVMQSAIERGLRKAKQGNPDINFPEKMEGLQTPADLLMSLISTPSPEKIDDCGHFQLRQAILEEFHKVNAELSRRRNQLETLWDFGALYSPDSKEATAALGAVEKFFKELDEAIPLF